jgi:hypothetical protein
MRVRFSFQILAVLFLFWLLPGSAHPAAVDLFSDTWVAADDLGRKLPLFPEAPAPRPNRTVAIFYFLWHGAHIHGGPFDISKILLADPQAMQKPASPLWGPLHAPHHWAESIFGYYLTRDEAVLRKHAQMLSDAGVDVVIFDVTNQITYRDDYMTLLRVWAEERERGNPTPQVAFLTPFWAPAKVTRELWQDLYAPGLYRDLWFQWEGSPLILADPALLFGSQEQAQQNTPAELLGGHTLGQSFTIDRPILAVSGRFPTWNQSTSSVTVTLRSGGPTGEKIAAKRFASIADNAWLTLELEKPADPGAYYLEASDPDGRVGWWSHTEDKFPLGEAFADALPMPGDRTLRILFSDEVTQRVCDFFTFRKPQPDYFRGPTQPNMWSWLEVYPQHRFTNSAALNEQMSVGVAQNAVHDRLGSMSEPGAHGRSFHAGATDKRPDAVRYGFNVKEQWERALREDPLFVFVTGWNEWIAGRFAEFNGVKLPVMFVDQFDQEHSRDIEPMRGGHGDDYYWQLVSYIRRYKGARPLPALVPQPILIDGKFSDWLEVQPEFRDTIGDPVQREERGWDPKVTYRNRTGRNDFVASKISWDLERVYFYARTRESISAPSPVNWMNLLIDIDADPATGWLGSDFIVNLPEAGSLARHSGKANEFAWNRVAESGLQIKSQENQLELSIPWRTLGRSRAATLHFKWADDCFEAGDWSDFTLNGDTAPNDRFNYRALIP